MEEMIKKTIEQDRREQARRYYAEGVSVEIIARVVGKSVDVVESWLEKSQEE